MVRYILLRNMLNDPSETVRKIVESIFSPKFPIYQ